LQRFAANAPAQPGLGQPLRLSQLLEDFLNGGAHFRRQAGP
jgi:hypothetical protein